MAAALVQSGRETASTHFVPLMFTPLSRRQKQLVVLGHDLLITAIALRLAFVLRLGSWSPDMQGSYWWVLGSIVLVRTPVFIRMGLYRAVLRQSVAEITRICLRGTVLAVFGTGAIAFFFAPEFLPRSIILIEAAISAFFVITCREAIAHYLNARTRRRSGATPVLIYGAGGAGIQLAKSLGSGHEFWPVAFLDDEPTKWGLTIGGLQVHPRQAIERLVKRYGVTMALLAVPSLTVNDRRRLAKHLEGSGLRVKQVPGVLDMLRGKMDLNQLSDFKPSTLLGRGTVMPDSQLFRKVVPGKSVMVTGAGGSIGSEICRQVAALGPKHLVLFERNEFALYQIEMEIAESFPEVQISAVLGSVLDRVRLGQTYRRFQVASVYHAAAYKHVPLVEQNPLAGVNNNVFGTFIAAEEALEAGVRTFVLISTDKAVRPSNVMGASKRLAELACLMLSERSEALSSSSGQSHTRFVMVRFGNVLDSAGSVVPLFRKQISRGGPVTVTHREVTRYFMTIPEAAQLVIQASALGNGGGEVFLLDMGAGIKVYDLAKRMIDLATLDPGQEIQIKFTGLRPGEKLVEELLVDPSCSKATDHPKIFKAVENGPSAGVVGATLTRLSRAVEQDDLASVYRLLAEVVEGYRPPKHQFDVLHRPDAPPALVVDRGNGALAKADLGKSDLG